MNLVPRSGGNTFAGSAFYSGAGEWSRSNNVDDELRAIGILEPSALVNAFDVNGSLGGPILRDRLVLRLARTFGQATASPARTPTSTPVIRRIGTTRATKAS